MAVFGILIGSGYFTSEEPAGQRSEDLTYGIVLFILGAAFIAQGQSPLLSSPSPKADSGGKKHIRI